jgi:hypothetical protein
MTKIIVDANILCLVVAGYFKPSVIGKHKRLQAYGEDDFELVKKLISPFEKVLTCPHILTETSNLLANTNENERRTLLEGLRLLLADMEEVQMPSASACDHKVYHRLGLTDAVLLSMEISGAPLLTADFDLCAAAGRAGREAINYNHHRNGSY